MEMRLQKYLAMAGACSRRKAEEYIAQGRVRVNGLTITEMGYKINDGDKVSLNGKPVAQDKPVYLMLHKPEGYVTTASDEQGRPTVMALLTGVRERVYPIGRLDYNTSGLLLLTNDGDLAYRLTHPKHNIDKVYIARLKGSPTRQALALLEAGVVIDETGRKTAPAKVQRLKGGGTYTTIKILIHEGRNRQVRKMCETVGCPVAGLKRVATGKLSLGDLPKGKYRPLTEDEIKYLKRL